MRHFALIRRTDIEKWAVVGLLHDIDFEEYRCSIAGSKGVAGAEGFRRNISARSRATATSWVSDVKLSTLWRRWLYAMDELTGLIAATALMRPSRSILDLEVSSVKKMWKQMGFAAGVNREVIETRAAMLGMEVDVLIAQTIAGMRTAAEEIGLKARFKERRTTYSWLTAGRWKIAL
jgi:predicted hydrolase (HD superfamily)